ncbi:MAG: Cyclase, partial [Pseudonocardia sp.]|nr:Cyclase [Pseudonocardia sp.]
MRQLAHVHEEHDAVYPQLAYVAPTDEQAWAEAEGPYKAFLGYADKLRRATAAGGEGGPSPFDLDAVRPEQIRAAAALVRQGKAISMGLPLDLKGPQSGGFRANPLNMMT